MQILGSASLSIIGRILAAHGGPCPPADGRRPRRRRHAGGQRGGDAGDQSRGRRGAGGSRSDRPGVAPGARGIPAVDRSARRCRARIHQQPEHPQPRDAAGGRRRRDHPDALGIADHAVADAVRRLRHAERGRAPDLAGRFGRLPRAGGRRVRRARCDRGPSRGAAQPGPGRAGAREPAPSTSASSGWCGSSRAQGARLDRRPPPDRGADRRRPRPRSPPRSATCATPRRCYISVVGERPAELEDPLVPYPALPESQEAAAAKAAVDSPTVLIADADIEVAKAELRGSRSGYYPRFDLELGAAANDNLDGVRGGDVEAQALLVLRYNLFRGGADIAREREAFARVREAREGLRQAQRDAEEEARVAYNALQHRAGPRRLAARRGRGAARHPRRLRPAVRPRPAQPARPARRRERAVRRALQPDHRRVHRDLSASIACSR